MPLQIQRFCYFWVFWLTLDSLDCQPRELEVRAVRSDDLTVWGVFVEGLQAGNKSSLDLQLRKSADRSFQRSKTFVWFIFILERGEFILSRVFQVQNVYQIQKVQKRLFSGFLGIEVRSCQVLSKLIRFHSCFGWAYGYFKYNI